MAVIGRRERRTPRRGVPGGPLALVAALAGLYALVFLVASKARFDRFAFRDEDLALNAQALWMLLRGSTHNSILGISFLGNHLHWATFLLAPFYAIFPSPLFLLSVQTLALAAGAFPLYRIAERRLGSDLGVVVVGAYLIYPALGYVNFSEFHMPSLIVPLLFWAHDAYETDRRNLLVALLVAVALVQENFPLFGAAYGALLAVHRRDLARGLPLTIGCLVYFYLGLQIFPPLFLSKASVALPTSPALPNFYPELGRSVPDLLINFARDPVGAFANVYEPRKGLWLAQLFLPLALLPLIGVNWLLPAAPFFAQHFLSSRANETSIRSHYAAEMIPFLFIAAVVGLARVRRIVPGRLGAILLGGALIAAVVAGNIALGCQFFLVRDILHMGEKPPDPLRKRLLAMIPPDAATVASFDVLPHLVNRFHIYPLHDVGRGHLLKRKFAFRLPSDTRYALTDWTDDLTFRTYDSGRLDQNLARAFADGSWSVLHAEGSITLLTRNGSAPAAKGAGREAGGGAAAGGAARGGKDDAFVMPPRPFVGEPQLFEILPSPPPGFREPKLLVDGALELLSASVVPAMTDEGEGIRVGLLWRLRAPVPGQYLVKVEIIDTKGTALASADHPLCYNLFPPTRWDPSQIVRDDVWLPVSAPIPPGDYAVAVGVEGYRAARRVGIERLSADVVITTNRAIVSVWKNRP